MDPTEILSKLDKHITSNGRLRSERHVEAFVKLMKDCSKLAARSLCIEVLQATEDRDLMKSALKGGVWQELAVWLKEATTAENWYFTRQLLLLYVGIPMSLSILKHTDTPKIVRQLGKSSDKELRELSENIVGKWKKVVRGKDSSDDKNGEKRKKSKKEDEKGGKSKSKEENKPSGPALFDMSMDDAKLSVHKAPKNESATSSNIPKDSKHSKLSNSPLPEKSHRAAVKTAKMSFRPTGTQEHIVRAERPSLFEQLMPPECVQAS